MNIPRVQKGDEILNYFEFAVLFALLTDAGSLFLNASLISRIEIPFFKTITNPLLALPITTTILIVTSSTRIIRRLTISKRVLTQLSFWMVALGVIGYLESQSIKFYQGGLFTSLWTNFIFFNWLYSLSLQRQIKFLKIATIGCFVAVVWSVFFTNFASPNRVAMELFIFCLTVTSLLSNLWGGKRQVAANGVVVPFVLVVSASALASFRSGLVLGGLWLFEIFTEKKYTKIFGYLVSFLVIVSIIKIPFLSSFVKSILFFGDSSSVVKGVSADFQNALQLDGCNRFESKSEAQNQFFQLINIFGVSGSVEFNWHLEKPNITLDADLYSFLVRVFNWFWFVGQSLAQPFQICEFPASSLVNPFTGHTIQGALLRVAHMNFVIFVCFVLLVWLIARKIHRGFKFTCFGVMLFAFGTQTSPIIWSPLLLCLIQPPNESG